MFNFRGFQDMITESLFRIAGIVSLVLSITHLFPHSELVHLPYIAVATNTKAD